MRRYLWCFAMLPAVLFLPVSSTLASTRGRAAVRPHHHALAGRSHAAPVRSVAIAHGRRKSARLRPTEPVVTALIDPVPRGKFPFPPALKGSHESLLRQNVRSQRDGLERVQDDADLLELRRQKQLVALPVTAALVVDERLPANRRYCRSWTAEFLSDLSRVHYGRFHRTLQVNSAVRTVDYQRHLERVNGNAAPAEGDDASPHLTGATIDIAKKGLSMTEIGWLRAYLMPLQAAGKIDVEEEFYQSCFHITVYRAYRPEAVPAKPGSRGRPVNAALLAARVP